MSGDRFELMARAILDHHDNWKHEDDEQIWAPKYEKLFTLIYFALAEACFGGKEKDAEV